MAERFTTQMHLKPSTLITHPKDFRASSKSVQFPESNLAREPIHRYTIQKNLIEPYRVAREMAG